MADIFLFIGSTAASGVCYLSILFWGCLDGVIVKDVKRCSARRAHRIRGFLALSPCYILIYMF